MPAFRWLFHFLENRLCCSEEGRAADVLFVLAGRMDRKFAALMLFRQGIAPRLLVSVGRFEIRPFSKMPLPVPVDLLEMARPTAPAKRHFFVLFEAGSAEVEYVRPGRLGTLTEIAALSRWLQLRPEVQSLLILSNGIHLRRVRLCCRFLLPARIRATFLESPASSREAEGAGALLLELAKLAVYWILLGIGGRAIAGRRAPERTRPGGMPNATNGG